jgi:hypothetical protein
MGYDFGARMYNPQIGRWMATDPWEEDVSPYIYVANDPVNFFDPNGKGRFGKWLKEKADDIGDAAKQVGNWVSEKADDAGDWIRGDAHNDIVNTTRWIPGFGSLQLQYLYHRNEGKSHEEALDKTVYYVMFTWNFELGKKEKLPEEEEYIPPLENSEEEAAARNIFAGPGIYVEGNDSECDNLDGSNMVQQTNPIYFDNNVLNYAFPDQVLSKLCVPSIISWLSSYYGDPKSLGEVIMDYGDLFGMQNSLNLINTGVTSDIRVNMYLTKYFYNKMIGTGGYLNAIQNGNPIMTELFHGYNPNTNTAIYHNVLIIGYDPSNSEYIYFDPATGTTNHAPANDFNSVYSYEIYGIRKED